MIASNQKPLYERAYFFAIILISSTYVPVSSKEPTKNWYTTSSCQGKVSSYKINLFPLSHITQMQPQYTLESSYCRRNVLQASANPQNMKLNSYKTRYFKERQHWPWEFKAINTIWLTFIGANPYDYYHEESVNEHVKF